MNNKDRSLRGEEFNETRLHNLVAVTIENFVISAKENLEDVEEPLRVGPESSSVQTKLS